MGQFEMVDTPRDSLRILEAGLQDHEQPCDTDALNPLWYIVIIVTVVFLLFLGRTAWMWKCQMSLPSSALNSGAPESMELRSDSSPHNIQSEELEKEEEEARKTTSTTVRKTDWAFLLVFGTGSIIAYDFITSPKNSSQISCVMVVLFVPIALLMWFIASFLWAICTGGFSFRT